MFGSTVLDLAIGLIFTFLIISLVASAATEAVASILLWRANALLQGVKDLLNDQQFNGLALALYNHDFVNPRSNGTATSEKQLTAKPSYIDSKQFAAALIDIAGLVAGTDMAALQQRVGTAIQDPQLRNMLTGIIGRAGGNINRIRDDIASWFDNGMDRVAGAYKRKTQLCSCLIALAVAVALNVDTIAIAKTLWEQPALVKELPTLSVGTTPDKAIEDVKQLGLPFGWDDKAVAAFGTSPNWQWLFSFFGWLIAAVATLFGRPSGSTRFSDSSSCGAPAQRSSQPSL